MKPLHNPEMLSLRVTAGNTVMAEETTRLLADLALSTICQEASCPNVYDCFSRRTVSFLILGKTCTRNCRFCGVQKGQPVPPDPGEPARLSEAVRRLELKHVVITSVTRDDLLDGGAGSFVACVEAIRTETRPPAVAPTVECLVPDFGGQHEPLLSVVAARPDVLGHNVETVPRLYPAVRPGAVYERSLEVLRQAKRMAIGRKLQLKSSLMLGLGERYDEVVGVLRDLRAAGCDHVTLGQYLAPTSRHCPVIHFLRAEEFDNYRLLGEELGFSTTTCGPNVRSSYRQHDGSQHIAQSG